MYCIVSEAPKTSKSRCPITYTAVWAHKCNVCVYVCMVWVWDQPGSSSLWTWALWRGLLASPYHVLGKRTVQVPLDDFCWWFRPDWQHWWGYWCCVLSCCFVLCGQLFHNVFPSVLGGFPYAWVILEVTTCSSRSWCTVTMDACVSFAPPGLSSCQRWPETSHTAEKAKGILCFHWALLQLEEWWSSPGHISSGMWGFLFPTYHSILGFGAGL